MPLTGEWKPDGLETQTLLNAVLVTGAGAAFTPSSRSMTFQASGLTTAGAGAASIQPEGSNAASPGVGDWVPIGSPLALTLGTTKTSAAATVVTQFRQIRGNVVSISGTNAAVSLFVTG